MKLNKNKIDVNCNGYEIVTFAKFDKEYGLDAALVQVGHKSNWEVKGYQGAMVAPLRDNRTISFALQNALGMTTLQPTFAGGSHE